MAALANVATPRILSVMAVLGLTVLAGHESPATRGARSVASPALALHGDVIEVPAFRDARPWNDGGMVIAPPAIDPAISVPRAVVDLLSGLFHALGSLPV